LIGDRIAARDAFLRAAALNPGDDRIAYDLARAHEELGETSAALSEFCRYLALSPQGREAQDVRSRLPRLAPGPAAQANARILQTFRTAINHYDAKRFDAAALAFDEVARSAPRAIEARFNSALARLAAGHREQAARDFELYLSSDPASSDRTEVARTIDALRKPVFDAGTAFRLGLIPGFGQFYTKRPAFGVLTLATVTAAAVAAFYERTGTRQVPYVDPNGLPAPYEEEFTERPYMSAAIAAGAAVTLGAAFESFLYARHSRKGTLRTSLVDPRNSPMFDVGEFRVQPTITARGAAGVSFTRTF
jgi:tetratricopeptide (TPR) repeat protein